MTSDATRTEQVELFCKQRGIQTLVHFTRIENLRSILRKGLLSRRELESLAKHRQPNFNDHQRFDGYRGAVCLSIEFPNDWMFAKYSSEDRAAWVVLCLDASMLWKLDCAFCRENAASTVVKISPLDARKQPYALKQMYTDYYYDIQRQSIGIPDNFPTHPQAEVLVFDPIPASFIKQVCFASQQARDEFMQQARPSRRERSYECDSRYFGYRSDHYAWTNSLAYSYIFSRRDDFNMR